MASNFMLNSRTSDRQIFLLNSGEEMSVSEIENQTLNVQTIRHFSVRKRTESVSKKSLIVPNVSENSGSISELHCKMQLVEQKKKCGVCKMSFASLEKQGKHATVGSKIIRALAIVLAIFLWFD